MSDMTTITFTIETETLAKFLTWDTERLAADEEVDLGDEGYPTDLMDAIEGWDNKPHDQAMVKLREMIAENCTSETAVTLIVDWISDVANPMTSHTQAADLLAKEVEQ